MGRLAFFAFPGFGCNIEVDTTTGEITAWAMGIYISFLLGDREFKDWAQ